MQKKINIIFWMLFDKCKDHNLECHNLWWPKSGHSCLLPWKQKANTWNSTESVGIATAKHNTMSSCKTSQPWMTIHLSEARWQSWINQIKTHLLQAAKLVQKLSKFYIWCQTEMVNWGDLFQWVLWEIKQWACSVVTINNIITKGHAKRKKEQNSMCAATSAIS